MIFFTYLGRDVDEIKQNYTRTNKIYPEMKDNSKLFVTFQARNEIDG